MYRNKCNLKVYKVHTQHTHSSPWNGDTGRNEERDRELEWKGIFSPKFNNCPKFLSRIFYHKKRCSTSHIVDCWFSNWANSGLVMAFWCSGRNFSQLEGNYCVHVPATTTTTVRMGISWRYVWYNYEFNLISSGMANNNNEWFAMGGTWNFNNVILECTA